MGCCCSDWFEKPFATWVFWGLWPGCVLFERAFICDGRFGQFLFDTPPFGMRRDWDSLGFVF